MSGFISRPRPSARLGVGALAVAGVALITLITLGTAGSASAATTASTTTNPAAAAAGWLAQQFSNAANKRVPSGDHIELSFNDGTKNVFYYDGGGTADATFALAATHSGKAKIDTAVNYIAAHLDDYVDYSGAQGGPYYGSIGKAAVAAVVDGQDPNNFGGHHLLTELKADECQTGSTTCTPGANDNVFSSVSTSFIVIAEARGAEIDGATYAPSANLVNLLLSEQCANGGFSSDIPAGSGDQCAADVDATGYAVMALQSLGGHTAEIGKAADYLVSTRGANGAWSDNGGANVDSTALAAAALDIAGRSATSPRNWLVSQRVTDGPTVGTGSQRGAIKYQGAYDPNSSIKATSDAVLGLVPHTSLATLTAAGAKAGTSVLALAPATTAHHSVTQGHSQTVSATGFEAGEKVSGELHSKPVALGSAVAGAKGSVALRFTVPAHLKAGTHTVTLTGARSGLVTSVKFAVAAAPNTTTPTKTPVATPVTVPVSTVPVGPALADTGIAQRQTRDEILLGCALLVAGAGALLIGRRRGRHSR